MESDDTFVTVKAGSADKIIITKFTDSGMVAVSFFNIKCRFVINLSLMRRFVLYINRNII